MAVREGEDFTPVKNAFYSEGMVRQSGNLVVTPHRIILNVIQTIDPMDSMRGGSHTITGAVKELKEDVQEAKKSFSEIFDYGKGLKKILQLAEIADSITDFEQKAAALGLGNSKSISIDRNDVREYKIGFFKGFQIFCNDGTVYKIRTGKLKKIREMMGKA
ncbi:MAG TPA: hypothetical protein PK253_16445 [Spirochaetota bacterium]|nr:hypothetical protein [Spirochaetota bacterium]